MAQTVVGIFDSVHDAQTAETQLISAGIDKDRIDISISRNDGTHDKTIGDVNHHDESVGDSISHFFKNLFSDDETESKRYSDVARSGHLVTVHTNSREESEMAARILDQYGTVDVNERWRTNMQGSFLSANSLSTDSTNAAFTSSENNTLGTTPTSNQNNITGTPSDTIPVIEEELQVGKREIETGTVRVRSRIVERPVEESLRLREERVWVERNKVNRPATEAELSGLKDENIELTQHAEIPVVAKEARVVEEIRVGKAVEEHEQTIQDTVRSTEVDIDENRQRNDVGLAQNQ